MTAGLLYSCQWRTNQWNHDNNSWDRGWDMLLFIGIETINRDDGVVINNYRFHDIVNNKSVLSISAELFALKTSIFLMSCS